MPHCYYLPQANNKPAYLENRLVSKSAPCTPEDSIDRLTASQRASADMWQRLCGFK
jgi:hypothetical protein